MMMCSRIAVSSRSRSAVSKRSDHSLVTVASKFTQSLDELCLFLMPCADRAKTTIKIFPGPLFQGQRLNIRKQTHGVIIASRVAALDFPLDLQPHAAGAALLENFEPRAACFFRL